MDERRTDHIVLMAEAVSKRCSFKKVFLEISLNSKENTGARVTFLTKLQVLDPSFFFNKVAGLRPAILLKETLAQVFPCEFCEISKNIFLIEHLRTTASVYFKPFSFASISNVEQVNVCWVDEFILCSAECV